MVTEYEQTKAHVERVMTSASDLMQKDMRARRMADWATVEAMREHGPVDPERSDRDAADIAFAACALLLARIYDEDGEIKALRYERDQYKKLAESTLAMTPPRLVITS